MNPSQQHSSNLLSVLESHVTKSEKNLYTHHPHLEHFFLSKKISPRTLRDHAARIAASGALAGTLLLSGPLHTTVSSIDPYKNFNVDDREKTLSKQLGEVLPKLISPLSENQEQRISDIVGQIWGIRATAQLQHERLNHVYGLIGAEQHLPRFPGDSLSEHESFQREGITPGLGAWGYFSSSKSTLTQDLVEKEKYYVAVQTLYLPDWQERLQYLREWYKYRKVLVINPLNGKTIVCDIADSGPAQFTGKQFGGSPEVMAYLKLNTGMQKGPVVLLFVDDPENTVPLGPVEYNVSIGTQKSVSL